MLFAPLTVRGLTLPNRIVVPAMVTRLSGEDGLVNRDVRERYLRFARGEPGLIVVEAMAVHRAKSGPLLRLCGDEFIPGLAELARAIHGESAAKVMPQIIHFLKIARSGWRQTVDMLGAADLRAIVDDYAAAAARARAAGFDGVELHMAHAYTLASFLSRLNPRRDAYGSTLDNRLRLPSEVLAAVRRAVGDDFPVGVRFLGEECIKNGYTVADAALIAERLVRLGADYVSLSAGGKFEDALHRPGEVLYPYTGYSGDRCMPGANYPDGANLYLADGVRAHLRARGLDAPVVASGKIGTRAIAEAALAAGQADLIGMARALLADPDIPRKWRDGRDDEVVRCVYGNVCKALDETFHKVVCTLWPKGSLQAPGGDLAVDDWGGPPALRGAIEHGRVVLDFAPGRALGGALYGWQVERAEGQGGLAHYASARGRSTRFEDRRAVGGGRYRYRVRPYDRSGRRGPWSSEVAVDLPLDFAAEAESPPELRVIEDPGQLDACTAGRVT